MTTASLFLTDVSISMEETAPQHILDRERSDSTFPYHAVLKKKVGRITANDFLEYTRRFSFLCNTIYQSSKLELLKNAGVPLGPAAIADSMGWYIGNPGETIDASRLTSQSFQEMFENSSSVILSIRPMVSHSDTLYSFGETTWTRGRPQTIFFYAQQGGGYDLKGSQRPLENLLLRKLFHLSGVAPSLNFEVELGIDAWLDETQGKLF